MRNLRFTTSLLFAALAAAPLLFGQAGGSKPEPDVIVFVDGEKLSGQLESATGASVIFKSDILGEVTVPWSKIQEIHSSQKFAAIPNGVRLHKREDASQVPQGTLSATGQ